VSAEPGSSGATPATDRRSDRRAPWAIFLVALGAALLSAAGHALLAVESSVALATLAVIAAGIGFALPYGSAVAQAQRLCPREPTEHVALVTLVGTAIPVPLVPLIEVLLEEGYGTQDFLGLAALVAIAGALNLRARDGLARAEPIGRRRRTPNDDPRAVRLMPRVNMTPGSCLHDPFVCSRTTGRPRLRSAATSRLGGASPRPAAASTRRAALSISAVDITVSASINSAAPARSAGRS
jgi:hypothetical protein